MSKKEFNYYEGYPERYLEDTNRDLYRTIGICVPFVLLAGSAVLFCILVLLGGWNFTSALGLMVSGGLLILISWGFIRSLRDCYNIGIIPYFKKRVGDIDTFSNGHAVAKNCRQLDRIAFEKIVSPISKFGFNDDFSGEKVQWHNPEKGLETITLLLREIRRHPKTLDNAKAVISDLERIEDALKKAKARGILFSLLLRSGDTTSGMEMDQRKGSFF